MSCPDWVALVAARAAHASDGAPGSPGSDGSHTSVDPTEFAAARRHLESCPACRRTAIAADPLLVFATLPQPLQVSALDVSAMQDSVLTLVRASRVATAQPSPPSISRRRSARGVKAAAGLLLASLLALSGTPRTPATHATAAAVGADAQALSHWIDDALELAPPAVEDLDRPGARIYELPQGDLAVVMIVDASLDV